MWRKQTWLMGLLLAAIVTSHCAGGSVDERSQPPYLKVQYQLVEAGGDKPAAVLKSGQPYEIVITLTADQRPGIKINSDFGTQQAVFEIIGDQVKYSTTASGRGRRNAKSRTVSVDPKTGQARLAIALSQGDSLPAANVRLKLIADLMVCDRQGTFCVKTRESAALALPKGQLAMRSEPLQFNAADKPRVVLKVGDKAPEFSAQDEGGKSVNLSDYRGKKNVLVVFGRAHW